MTIIFSNRRYDVGMFVLGAKTNVLGTVCRSVDAMGSMPENFSMILLSFPLRLHGEGSP